MRIVLRQLRRIIREELEVMGPRTTSPEELAEIDAAIEKFIPNAGWVNKMIIHSDNPDATFAEELYDLFYNDLGRLYKRSGIYMSAAKKGAEALRSKVLITLQDLADDKESYEKFLQNVKNLATITQKAEKIVGKNKKTTQKSIEKHAEAPPGSPLGRIALPNQRPNLPMEPNTEIEDELESDIINYANQNVQPRKHLISLVKDLIDKKLYKKTFHPPTKENVYRGLILTKSQFEQLFKFDPGVAKSGSKEETFTWKLKTGFSLDSWTTSLKIAKEFSRDERGLAFTNNAKLNEKKMYAVVIHAKTSDNADQFIDLGSIIGGVSAEDHEIIAISDIKCHKLTWTYESFQ